MLNLSSLQTLPPAFLCKKCFKGFPINKFNAHRDHQRSCHLKAFSANRRKVAKGDIVYLGQKYDSDSEPEEETEGQYRSINQSN